MNRALRLVGVRISIGGRVLIPNLDLDVAPGEVLTVMGASGSGKSTLLAFIGGFLDPGFTARGRIMAGGGDLTGRPARERRLGILFQEDLLFPHLSVGGNLAFGLPPDIRGGARRRAVDEALARAGLAGFAARDPATLSGGQRARVALLRTLLAQPRALLLDEPFSKLDSELRAEFRSFVFAHAREQMLPTLMVTHEREDAVAAGGNIVVLTSQSSSDALQLGALPPVEARPPIVPIRQTRRFCQSREALADIE